MSVDSSNQLERWREGSGSLGRGGTMASDEGEGEGEAAALMPVEEARRTPVVEVGADHSDASLLADGGDMEDTVNEALRL